MCGIVACYAKEGCYEKLLSALSRLEYRGYDSAGIALLCGGNFSVRKRAGGVSNLNGPPLPGDTGIGHTRWATHGAPTDVNAHPHLCGKFALVHNGIAENYAQLKAELAARGETFVSDTDSEVIVRLIARCYEGDFFAAVVAACARLQGAYAIAVLCADFPGEVVCARRGSPLVAGYAGGCPYVCSDVPALGGDAWFCPAEEGEFIHIRGGSLSFCDASGREIPKTFVRADASPVSGAPQQGSYMEREIAEIPSALARTLGGLRRLDFAPCARAMRGAKHVFAVACGTALHAALAFKDIAEAEARVPVLCFCSSEFRYRDPPVEAGDLVVAVSQSGETADTLEAVRLARGRGAYVIAVTNVGHSSLAFAADYAVVMRAGQEVAVAATKSYNCQLLCLYFLAAQLCFFRRGVFPAYFGELHGLPEAADAAFSCFPAVSRIAEAFAERPALFFLGRGAEARTAAEGALKVKEIARVFSEGLPAGELKHGPLALVGEGFPVLALSTSRALLPKMSGAVAEVKARGARVALFSQYEEAFSQSFADFSVRLPSVCERLMPAVSVIPLQYFACRLCLLRGLDPDRPKNLAKSVTVE